QSPLAAAYDAFEPVQPPEVLDAKILAMAKGAAGPATGQAAPAAKAAPAPQGAKPSPAGTGRPASPKPEAAATTPAAAKETAPRPPVSADDDDDEAPVARRPRWLVPTALAASVLAAVGVGIVMLANETSDTGDGSFATNPSGSLFARRARERSEAKEAAAEAAAAAAAREAEVERAPLPPPPIFEPEGPQVQDLDTAIALIRKELVLANQMAAIADDARSGEQQLQLDARQAPAPAGAAGQVAGAAPPSAPAATPADATGVVQPRDRRLGKILELYDGGNPDLAAASLEIFLRDFEDDPISRRIIEAQPKATDVAVE
ncbi:MAG: hypothetical protein OEW72_10445, partial [Gammaproteobacteria bacterium]|nr:hypothetical protein [Gammaproteobacteria bacterium]